jgi:hypothetical protein
VRISRKWFGAAILTILLAALLLYQFETIVIPEWKLRIVDETGNPVGGVRVRESWSHYVLEKEGHQEELVTDGQGFVRFPGREIRANALERTTKNLMSAVNVHGGRGPAAWVFVMGDYEPVSEEPYYVPGRPLAPEIVVRRR